MELNKLYRGDCLEIMREIPDKSIDMILCDLPYWTTACKWDTIIPFEPLWEQYKRIIKDNGAIVLFSSQPFTSELILSNIRYFKYCWYWKKERWTWFATSWKRPLMIIEDISIFYKKQPTYIPQWKKLDKPYRHVLPIKKEKFKWEWNMTNSLKEWQRVYKQYTHDTPTQFLEFPRDNWCRNSLHPTQKPVALFEYLIKTYTNEWDTVLDNCAGSGTTGVACQNTSRNFILIEKDPDYCNIIEKRLKATTPPLFVI